MDKQRLINSVVKILQENNLKREKIHMQKFISFLSDRIANIPFHFEIYKYGPFSSELSDELNSMVLWGDLSYSERQYNYEKNSLLLDKEIYEQIKEEIIKYSDLIEVLSFENMELYGTLFYILNHTQTQDKNEIINLFRDEKKDKFKSEDIKKSLAKLLKIYYPDNNFIN